MAEDGGAGVTGSEDDPDFISEEGVVGPIVPNFGMHITGFRGSPNPVFVPSTSTSLEEHDPDGVIPPFALWAMKYRRHSHLFSRADVKIRQRFGTGDHTVYVIDDGRDHAMVARMVGTDPDGCTYALVAQITMEAYEQLTDGGPVTGHLFAEARNHALCSVYVAEKAISNVSLVEEYDEMDQVPTEYRLPHPPVAFKEAPDGGGWGGA
jgi:hypothetical protein